MVMLFTLHGGGVSSKVFFTMLQDPAKRSHRPHLPPFGKVGAGTHDEIVTCLFVGRHFGSCCARQA
jgi:hypothetical protein